jgi:hypothetical protein
MTQRPAPETSHPNEQSRITSRVHVVEPTNDRHTLRTPRLRHIIPRNGYCAQHRAADQARRHAKQQTHGRNTERVATTPSPTPRARRLPMPTKRNHRRPHSPPQPSTPRQPRRSHPRRPPHPMPTMPRIKGCAQKKGSITEMKHDTRPPRPILLLSGAGSSGDLPPGMIFSSLGATPRTAARRRGFSPMPPWSPQRRAY